MNKTLKRTVITTLLTFSLIGAYKVGNATNTQVTDVQADESITYTVQTGDTLYNIATQHGISVYDLADYNGMTIDDTIMQGDVLYVNTASIQPTPSVEAVGANTGNYGSYLTEDQYKTLLAVVQQESGDGLYDANLAVMSVITNRVDEGYANNVYEVITQSGQFESYGEGYYLKHMYNIHPVTKQAVDDALNGVKSVSTTNFWSDWYADAKGVIGKNIGGNIFFNM